MSSKVESSVIQTSNLEEKTPVEEYFFEGAEKLLELWFANSSGRSGSLRRIPSESSLFVSERRLILKTCGRTRLLAALPTIIQLAADYAEVLIKVVSVYYSRKNFLRPELQPEEHRSFDAEDHTLEILMTDLDEDVLHIFTKDACENGKDCTE
ncbi:adenosylmethionine decarboxylase, partial [Ostertagia ostertagi]